MNEKPFNISIPDSDLAVLKLKLSLTRLADDDETDWTWGVPFDVVKRLLNRWQDGFDWRASEQRMNTEMPQFKRDIDVEGFGSVGVHYVHKKSDNPNSIPLLFVHGWPGTFLEGRGVFDLLVQGGVDHPSFHVVALDLPNSGFSDRTKKGFKLRQHAEVAHKLMIALGYDQYVTHGGGWGYAITRIMAYHYGPQHLVALHTNFPVPKPIEGEVPQLGEEERVVMAKTGGFMQTEAGYSFIQGTKPQTIGYGLADSPVAVLAWVGEKMYTWTDNYSWTDDQILEWIMVHWFSTAGPHAAGRIYYEAREGGRIDLVAGLTPGPNPNLSVPLGISDFPNEPLRFPPGLFTEKSVGNIVFYSNDHTHGGHFPAQENPEGLARDLRKMFEKGSKLYGVVKGRSGYLK